MAHFPHTSHTKEPVPTTERDDLTQEELWAQSEGLAHHNRTGAHTVGTDSSNDLKLEGSKAIPNKETSPPVAVQDKTHHVPIADKVKGQIMIAKGILKHDPNLTQEGEILKEEGEHVVLGKPHMEAQQRSGAH